MAAEPRPNLRIVRTGAEDAEPAVGPVEKSVTPGTFGRPSPHEAVHLLTDEVVVAVKRGEAGAWETILLACGDSLRGFLMVRLEYKKSDVDDALAETYLRAIDKMDSFRSCEARAFRAWLYKIASRVAVDRHRHKAKLTYVAEMDETAAVSEGDLADGMIFTEQSADLERALSQLAERDQELLYLRFIAGLTSDEVSRVVGKGPSAVRMQQMRALTVLKSLMDK